MNEGRQEYERRLYMARQAILERKFDAALKWAFLGGAGPAVIWAIRVAKSTNEDRGGFQGGGYL